MAIYREFEMALEEACEGVKKDFLERFKQGVYISAGGSNLEAFINELQKAFENVSDNFIKTHGLEKNASAKRRILNIAKHHAKKCIEEYSRIQ